MNKPRVAFVVELLGSKRHGGEQQAMLALAERLRPFVDLTIFSYAGTKGQAIQTSWPAKLREVPYLRELMALPAIGRRFVEQLSGFDLIHGSSTAMFANVTLPVPLILSVHSIRLRHAEQLRQQGKYPLILNSLVRKRLAAIERASFANASRVAVLQRFQWKFLCHRLGVPHEKMMRIPNPVDTERFHPQLTNQPFSSQPIILFAGRATIGKGIETILAAAPQIKGHLRIATSRIHQSHRQQAEKLGIDVVLNIPHDQMPKLYQDAQVFLLPSMAEDQPLTVLEAMASGIPTVTTAIGASDILDHGVEGIVIKPNDPVGLAEAVNGLLADTQKRTAMGQAARARAERDHSWGRVLGMYRELYSQVLNRPV